MEIGVKKEKGFYRHVREWRRMAIAFNETETGALVIASIPTGKRGDEMLGSRCEIHLRPDGTYWGEINANFVGYGKQAKPRLPKGLAPLAADHPGVEMLHAETQAVIRRIREWCMAVFIDMGFSPGEAVFLNTAREGELTWGKVPNSAMPYCSEDTPCCDRRGQYNGLGSGPLSFTCPKGCSCHD